MENIGLLILATIAGCLLGGFYFGSLWITVRQLPTTAWPMRLTIGSLMGRMAVVLLGFFIVMHGSWQRAIAGLVGFIIARTILTRYWGPKRQLMTDSLE
ncbi:MAG: ATP synthase subunit I [Limnospira sp.]